MLITTLRVRVRLKWRDVCISRLSPDGLNKFMPNPGVMTLSTDMIRKHLCFWNNTSAVAQFTFDKISPLLRAPPFKPTTRSSRIIGTAHDLTQRLSHFQAAQFPILKRVSVFSMAVGRRIAARAIESYVSHDFLTVDLLGFQSLFYPSECSN